MRIEWVEVNGTVFTEYDDIRIEQFADLFSVHFVDSSNLPTGQTMEFDNVRAAMSFIDSGMARGKSAKVNDADAQLRNSVLSTLRSLNTKSITKDIELLSPSELRELNRALNSFTSIYCRMENRVNNRKVEA